MVNTPVSHDLERELDLDEVERGLDKNGLVGARSGSDSDGSHADNNERHRFGRGGSKTTEQQLLRRPTKRARTDGEGERDVHGR
jgi:hypothetical protein